MSNLDLPIASLSQFQVSEIMSNLTILSLFLYSSLLIFLKRSGWKLAEKRQRGPQRGGGGSYGGLTDLLCTFGGGMWERRKGCPPPGVDGNTGRWKTMGNIMTILGCWGPRLAPLDFPLMAPGTQLRLITSKMILYYRRLAAQGHLEVLRTKARCSLDGQEGSVKEHNSRVLTTLTVPG